MLVTINTDASFCPRTGVAGYAFYMRSNTFLLKKSGVFRDTCTNPTEAEIKCIINATKVCLQQDKEITKLIINTDAKTAIPILTGLIFNSKAVKKWEPLYTMFKKLCDKRGVQVDIRWVEAHTGASDARSWVNQWCDEEARRELRHSKKRHKLYKKGKKK